LEEEAEVVSKQQIERKLAPGAKKPASVDLSLVLPSVDSFTADELLLARVTVGIARAGGAMFTGRLLECRVARLLDAHFPTRGTSSWDLRLADGTRIEVRSGHGSFSLNGSKRVDVWIFVDKSEAALRYFIATAAEVDDLRRRSRMLRCGHAEARLTVASEENLADVVKTLVLGLRTANTGFAR
jgi:hypothetical protein